MKLLFICQENTCRSQMAEGFARKANIDSSSAGVTKGDGVNSDAVLVMKEVGVDISNQVSNSIDSFNLNDFDYIISMCSLDAKTVCPALSIDKAINWNIQDPKGHDISTYRDVRDLIEQKVADFRVKMEQ